jgi:hypothetical protein
MIPDRAATPSFSEHVQAIPSSPLSTPFISLRYGAVFSPAIDAYPGVVTVFPEIPEEDCPYESLFMRLTDP